MAKPKELKDEAFYSIVPDPKGRRCADCIFFEQVPGTLDMSGTCERVAGIIDRDASCDNFELKNRPPRTRKRWSFGGDKHE